MKISLSPHPFIPLQVAANDVVITITGKREGIKQATFIMSKIVKSNLHKLNQNSMSLSYKDVKTAKPKIAGVTVDWDSQFLIWARTTEVDKFSYESNGLVRK